MATISDNEILLGLKKAKPSTIPLQRFHSIFLMQTVLKAEMHI